MKSIIFLTLVLVQVSYGVIYRLNDTEYLRMPPIYHVDDYHKCMQESNATFCDVSLVLVSDTPSDLLQMIHEYSEHTTVNFNHSRLHYGICLTSTCKQFLGENNTVDPKLALEGCLNESLWRDYRLRGKLTDALYCKTFDEPLKINGGDIPAAVFFISLLLLNIIGSLYDLYYIKGGEGNRLLLCFSAIRNWTKLVTQEKKDPYKERLRSIHGIRTINILLVILAHAPMALILSSANPHELEKTYHNIIYHITYNGNLIVQTFFVMTGCLLAYNIRQYAEKNVLKWTLILKGIVVRWLRLTPAYAVVLIFTVTWLRFVATGPFWETYVGLEVKDCWRDGWLNVLYLNNYIDNSQCIAQTWYLAADMQMYILGLFVCILVKTSKARKLVLVALFIIGALIPGIHTYVQDLDAAVFMSPETGRNFFIADPTFNHSYKRGHTNIPSTVLGLALGEFLYKGLKDESRVKNYKKLGFLYKLTFPMGVGLILFGMVFYADRPRPSVYLRALYAIFSRPFFGLLVVILLVGVVFKFENLYRRILEWRGWRVPARVSYSAFLLHVTIIRVLSGMNSTLQRMGMTLCLKEVFAIIFITFLAAYPFWILVESPLNEAVLMVFGLSKKEKNEDGGIKTEYAMKESDQITVVDLDDRKEVNVRS